MCGLGQLLYILIALILSFVKWKQFNNKMQNVFYSFVLGIRESKFGGLA